MGTGPGSLRFIPARAGWSDRYTGGHDVVMGSSPRVRGGRPISANTFGRHRFIPRARGVGASVLAIGSVALGSSPTRAGWIRGSPLSGSSPRARGPACQSTDEEDLVEGSSPRERGSLYPSFRVVETDDGPARGDVPNRRLGRTAWSARCVPVITWLYLPDRICLRTLLTTYFGRSFLSAGMTIGRAAPFFTYTLCDPLVRSRRQPYFSTSFARSRDDVMRTSLSGARAVDTGGRAVLQVCSQARPRLVSAAPQRADNRGIANSIRRRF